VRKNPIHKEQLEMNVSDTRLQVVSCGFDRELALLRAQILQLAGCEVTTCLNSDEALSRVGGRSYDVLLICHTLEAELCTRLAGIFRAANPHGRIVTLILAEWQRPCTTSDSVVPGMDGPTALVEAVLGGRAN
jgi:CheY-like chemotaxis protein